MIIQKFDRKFSLGRCELCVSGERDLRCLKKPKQVTSKQYGGWATLHPYLPKDLREKVERVAKKLFSLGMPFVGFDIIAM